MRSPRSSNACGANSPCSAANVPRTWRSLKSPSASRRSFKASACAFSASGHAQDKERELVAQVDHAGATGVQRNRVVAAEGEAASLARLPVSARDRSDNVRRPDSAQIPSLDAPDDRVEPRPWRGGGEAAARALSRLSLTCNRRHERFGDLGRGFETLDANRHHVEVARTADLAARRRQGRDRHSTRFADTVQKEPRNRTRFLQGSAHVRTRFGASSPGPGNWAAATLTARTSAARQCCGQASERIG